MKRRTAITLSSKGSALITALLIVSIVAILTSTMAYRQHLDIKRTQLLFNHEILYQNAQGIMLSGVSQFRNSERNHSPMPINTGNLGLDQYPHGGQIIDAEQYWNINWLRDEKHIAGFALLLQQVTPNMSQENANTIARQLQQQLAQEPALLFNVAMIQRYAAINADLYHALKPYLTALPNNSRINMNTASIEVLQSLSDAINLQEARRIIQQRPYDDVDELAQRYAIAGDIISSQSHFFWVHANIRLAEQEVKLRSLWQLKLNTDKAAHVQLLQQFQL